jgi:hypothetical protein
MVTISVTAEAFAAIEATLPKAPGSQSGREARPDGRGGLLVVKSHNEGRQEVWQLGAGAMQSDEPLDILAPSTSATRRRW